MLSVRAVSLVEFIVRWNGLALVGHLKITARCASLFMVRSC